MIAADVVVYAASPVLQVKDVPMERFEIRPLSAFLHMVPTSRQNSQTSLLTISGHYGSDFNRLINGSFERFPLGFINELRVAPFVRKASRLLVDTKLWRELTRTHTLLRCGLQMNHDEGRW
jgi:hypothetical protein